MTHHFFSDADMKQIAIWIFVLVFVSMFPFVCVDASADPCDSAIFKTTDKKDELAYRRFSNRCEGFYGAKVANPAFKVVGLTIGSVTYNMDAAEIIKISVPNHRKRTIRIRAEAIPSKTYYRMDAILVGDQKLEWPIKDILLKRPEELASGKIAVIGWIGKGGKKVFVRRQLGQGRLQRVSQDLFVIYDENRTVIRRLIRHDSLTGQSARQNRRRNRLDEIIKFQNCALVQIT